MSSRRRASTSRSRTSRDLLDAVICESILGIPIKRQFVRDHVHVLLDVGAERATNPLTRGLHLLTAELASHVSHRDSFSAAAMRRAGAQGAEWIVPDLVFAHPALARAEQPGVLVVGVMAYYRPTDNPIRGAEAHLNADGLVAQVLAARSAAAELANQIRLSTASYAAAVESLLACATTETLGLAA